MRFGDATERLPFSKGFWMVRTLRLDIESCLYQKNPYRHQRCTIDKWVQSLINCHHLSTAHPVSRPSWFLQPILFIFNLWNWRNHGRFYNFYLHRHDLKSRTLEYPLQRALADDKNLAPASKVLFLSFTDPSRHARPSFGFKCTIRRWPQSYVTYLYDLE